MNQFNFH